jgi:hypothetical protein
VDWKFFEGTAYGRIFIHGLTTRHELSLIFQKSENQEKNWPFSSRPTRQSMDSLQLLIGSCAMKGLYGWQKMLFGKKEYPVYQAMAKEQAHGMLWTGDNLYFIGESDEDEKTNQKNISSPSKCLTCNIS